MNIKMTHSFLLTLFIFSAPLAHAKGEITLSVNGGPRMSVEELMQKTDTSELPFHDEKKNPLGPTHEHPVIRIARECDKRNDEFRISVESKKRFAKIEFFFSEKGRVTKTLTMTDVFVEEFSMGKKDGRDICRIEFDSEKIVENK